MMLSPHFTLAELTRSVTAQRLGIINGPLPDDAKANLSYLVTAVLEPARQVLAHPIVISSGYRCERVNRAVGGARGSKHLQGLAADIPYNSLTLAWADAPIFARQSGCDLVIVEQSSSSVWLHVQAARNRPRHQIINMHK